MTDTPAEGIAVPSYLLPVIGAVGTFLAGLLVAADLEAYWRPGLAPVIGALFGVFVARPIARNRIAASRRAGEIDGAAFGEAATYAVAVASLPEEPPAPAPEAPAAKKAPRARKPRS